MYEKNVPLEPESGGTLFMMMMVMVMMVMMMMIVLSYVSHIYP